MTRHYLIIGAGAIGGMIGGLLAAHQQPVTLVDRPINLDHLRAHGLAVTLDDQRHTARPAVVGSVAEGLALSPDVAILTTKSFDTPGVIAEMQAAGWPVPPVISFQNGVDNETQLIDAFGAENTIYGTVTTAVSLPKLGEVIIEKPRGLGLGGDHPLVAAVAGDLRRAGFRVDQYANPAAMKWSKLITNLVANPTSAICDLTARQVFEHNGLFQIEIDSLREALAVMAALKLPPVSLPGGPVPLLAFGVRRLPAWLYRGYFTQVYAGARGSKMPSFHIDLSRGRDRSEIDFLHGAVVRQGQALGVPTPVNAALTEILNGIVADRRRWDDFRHQPDRLVAAVRRGTLGATA